MVDDELTRLGLVEPAGGPPVIVSA
jgi:hypothetical protein